VVDRDGLENRCACERTVGSNPTLSATNSIRFQESGQHQVVLSTSAQSCSIKGFANQLQTFPCRIVLLMSGFDPKAEVPSSRLTSANDPKRGIVRANSFTLPKRQNRISWPLIFLHFSGRSERFDGRSKYLEFCSDNAQGLVARGVLPEHRWRQIHDRGLAPSRLDIAE
jgi:hypothetical protein